ncbi:MAG: beta-N-acetylhexosaminidase [Mariprofundaceae bacterium]
MFEHLVIGLEGYSLNQDERQWLRDSPPKGVILFARNIESPEQVKALLQAVRDCAGKDTWAAIDEEGGRVFRMPWKPFEGRKHASEYGALFQRDPELTKKELYDDVFEVGLALKELGFTHNCAPVLDLFCQQGHSIIGKRSYGSDIQIVSELGAVCVNALQAAGIEAIGKHFPGHGRADADSHTDVPHVDVSLDVLLDEAKPFENLFKQGLGHVMTAHVIYQQVNSTIATLSPYWLQDVLRHRFEFEGLIWSDDLCMKGAGEDVPSAVKQAHDAGCDVLLVCEPEGVRACYQ